MLVNPSFTDNLELLAKQVVEGFIIGLHKSPFHGFSVEFAEHRLYNQGDPMRHIDWRVYGRTDRMYIKKFEEETNLRCCLLLDTSSSMYFPEDKKSATKIQFSCVAAASLIQLLKRQLDAAALGLFDSSLYSLSDCRSANKHYRLLTNELERLLQKPAVQKTTNVASALHEVAERMHKRSLVVIFSDMMDNGDELEEIFSALQHLKYNKHEVILFHIMDKAAELDFAVENRPYEFVDMESGEKIRLQPQQIREQYLSRMTEYQKSIEQRCHQYSIDREMVDLSQPVEQVLYSFLLKRAKMV